MSLSHGPSTVRNGLVFNFDAANVKCYPGSGTTFTELQNNGAGELINSPTFSSNLNGYFSFDGGTSSSSLQVPNNTALDSQTFSIEVWARTNATTQNGFWFEKGTVNSQYSLFQEGSSIRFRAHNGSTFITMISRTTATYINTTDWFHIVATCVSGDQRLYVNGVQIGTGTTTATFSTNAGGMSIGAYGGYTGGNSYFYNGDIGVVRVYNRVISQVEVKQNFEAFRWRYGI